MPNEFDEDRIIPNEIDAEAVVIGGSRDGELLPVGDPSIRYLVLPGLVYPVPGIKARVGEQENYVLTTATEADGSTSYRWVLMELFDRGVR